MSDKVRFNILQYAGTPTPYNAGSYVFKKGDPGESLFVVTHGEVEIIVNGQVVEQLGEGELFGEMALIDGVARSADAVAVKDSEIMEIDETRFKYMTQNNPDFALDVLRVITSRLRERIYDLEKLRSGG